MLYWNGVPERILANAGETAVVKSKDDILRVACLPVAQGTLGGDDNSDIGKIISTLKGEYGSSDAADICFLYEEVVEDPIMDENNIRDETKAAYDKVGNTAHLGGGDMKRAHSILTSLNYTQEEIDYAGTDTVNYQGVGCPHRHAGIQVGDSVLDMGSGLGVDSLIATKAVGSQGRVVGIDLSTECVQHANKRSEERGVADILTFVQSPIESIGHKIDNQEANFDVIISNGAFCLLPNKKKGFAECHRLLKSGGRIAICTTVIKDKLEDGVEWPLCMQTFARMEELEPMLQDLGFEDIEIDLSDSLMEIPEPEEEDQEGDSECEENVENAVEARLATEEDSNEGRFKVHNEDGQKQYRHLENFDMNMLCARVVIKARKPVV
jgi:ubiquinone/menaquinone biosynthesis C-methylase UbiE